MSAVARFFLVVVWLGAAGMTGVLGLMAYESVRTRTSPPRTMSIERLPAKQPRNPWQRWSVTEHLSAHHVLIAHVETDYLDEAVAITQQIAGPIKERYAEVLVYFHRPGRPDTLPPRRVQWTAAAGYVEQVYVTNEELRTKN